MSNGQGEVLVSPASADGVYITATHAAALDLDVDIMVTEGFWLELILVKFQPGLGSVDLESCELIGVRHLGFGTRDDGVGTGEDVRK